MADCFNYYYYYYYYYYYITALGSVRPRLHEFGSLETAYMFPFLYFIGVPSTQNQRIRRPKPRFFETASLRLARVRVEGRPCAGKLIILQFCGRFPFIFSRCFNSSCYFRFLCYQHWYYYFFLYIIKHNAATTEMILTDTVLFRPFVTTENF